MGNSSSTEIPAQYKRIVLQEPAQELENANPSTIHWIYSVLNLYPNYGV